MKRTTFSQFRNQAKKFFDAVERGEIIEIYRHGRPAAILSPVSEKDSSRYWSQRKPSLSLPGVVLSKLIIQERKKGF